MHTATPSLFDIPSTPVISTVKTIAKALRTSKNLAVLNKVDSSIPEVSIKKSIDNMNEDELLSEFNIDLDFSEEGPLY